MLSLIHVCIVTPLSPPSQHICSLEITSGDTVTAGMVLDFTLTRAEGNYTFKVHSLTLALQAYPVSFSRCNGLEGFLLYPSHIISFGCVKLCVCVCV